MTARSEAFREHGAAVLVSLLAGVSAADAAVEHGVTERTIARWLQRGREHPDGPYGDFAHAVDAARAAAVADEPTLASRGFETTPAVPAGSGGVGKPC